LGKYAVKQKLKVPVVVVMVAMLAAAAVATTVYFIGPFGTLV